MVEIFDWDSFDHTVGCYVTDYVLGSVVLLTAIIFLIILRNKNGKRALFNYITIVICCIFFFLYSVLGGLVHDKFLDNSGQKKWSLVWIAGSAIGLPAFILLGFVPFILYFPVYRIFWIVFPLILIIAFVIQWFIPNSFTFLMIFAAIMLVFMTVISSLVFIFTKFYQYRFVLSGILIIILATVLQLTKVGFDPVYFNYNCVYHVCMMIGAILLLTGFFLSDSESITTNFKNNFLDKPHCSKNRYDKIKMNDNKDEQDDNV